MALDVVADPLRRRVAEVAAELAVPVEVQQAYDDLWLRPSGPVDLLLLAYKALVLRYQDGPFGRGDPERLERTKRAYLKIMSWLDACSVPPARPPAPPRPRVIEIPARPGAHEEAASSALPPQARRSTRARRRHRAAATAAAETCAPDAGSDAERRDRVVQPVGDGGHAA